MKSCEMHIFQKWNSEGGITEPCGVQ